MKIDFELNFKFKGSRTYVHGTDLYNSVCDLIDIHGYKSIENIDMTFHKVTTSQMKGSILLGEDDFENKDINVLFSFDNEGKKHKVVLKENNSDVTERYEYPEQKIVDLCEFNFEGKSITLQESI